MATPKIFVTGHKGLLGHALVETLKASGYDNLLTVDRRELDLTNAQTTMDFLRQTQPDMVIHCAARVGGIWANKNLPAEFITQNLQMQTNVIHSAHLANVTKLVFFGSNCMYPVDGRQPLKEDELLKGPVEQTNLAYAAAKIAGYVQTQAYTQQYGRSYMCVIPASLYGPHDNFDPLSSHVTAALLWRFYQAKKARQPVVTLWGSGQPKRELLFVMDAAQGVLHLLKSYDAKTGPINMGVGHDYSIKEIAETIADVIGYEGQIEFDSTKPDGSPRKLLDSSRIQALGWQATTPLKTGLALTYTWMSQQNQLRGVDHV